MAESEQPGGASEPITLTDPDGAVTRVAPWSSWTREQVRAPGGEPALVTRLDQGQLWFAAGRRRSPWHHEVHVGPAVVSTPRGRFQATAEPDGGATIVCLSGRTRVVAGLREPVLLGPEQSAAVSADGRTLLVMDREASELEDTAAPLDDPPAEHERGATAAGVPGAAIPLSAGSDAEVEDDHDGPAALAVVGGDGGPPEDDVVVIRRFGWLPELAAVTALVALLIGAVVVFGRPGTDRSEQGERHPVTTTLPIRTSTTIRTTTSQAPTTTIRATTTTAVPTTTLVPTTTSLPPTISAGATALGELQTCRRAPGGVEATVRLSHRSGPASSFKVTVGLVDGADNVFARGEARSQTIQPGGTAAVTVLVKVAGQATGSCELLGVSPR